MGQSLSPFGREETITQFSRDAERADFALRSASRLNVFLGVIHNRFEYTNPELPPPFASPQVPPCPTDRSP